MRILFIILSLMFSLQGAYAEDLPVNGEVKAIKRVFTINSNDISLEYIKNNYGDRVMHGEINLPRRINFVQTSGEVLTGREDNIMFDKEVDIDVDGKQTQVLVSINAFVNVTRLKVSYKDETDPRSVGMVTFSPEQIKEAIDKALPVKGLKIERTLFKLVTE